MKSSTGPGSSLTCLQAGAGIVRRLLCLALALLLPSCSDSPKACFDRAVLSCNMFHDFASKGMEQQLASPSIKLTDPKSGASAPMKRKEVVDEKIVFVEQSLAKVRKLRQTDDNREMVQASIALQEYVLPVYRDDYQQLAKLYDEGAPKNAIEPLAASIAKKYSAQFRALSDRLEAAGKAYAARHNIPVVWDIRTSPTL